MRREIYGLIGELRAENRTVLLTTRCIEEAERLCDRVANMDGSRIIAQGTPRDIQEQTLGKALVEARFDASASVGEAAFAVERRADGRGLFLRTTDPGACVGELVRWCDAHGLRLEDIAVRRASLEDAFIALTARNESQFLVGLVPFIALGLTKLNREARIEEARMQWRAENRNVNFAVDDLRAFVGEGRVFEHARVIVRRGRITEVNEAVGDKLPAYLEIINGLGKTLLPGLIDMHSHLGASGFSDDDADEKDPEARRLMLYL